MANLFSTNNFVPFASGYSNSVSAGFTDQLFYAWKTFMVNAGWTVIASGDGLSAMSLTGDVFTHSFTGANGFANMRSWFVIREPAVYAGARRQLLIIKHNHTSGSDRYVVYSQQGFNLNTATGNGHSANSTADITATNPPIAFDEIVISSYYNTSFYNTLVSTGFFNYDLSNLDDDFYQNYRGTHGWNSYPWNSSTDDMAVPGLYYSFYASNAAPYSFYIMVSAQKALTNAGKIKGKLLRLFMFDELVDYTPNHPDPVVISKFTQYGGSEAGVGSIGEYFKTSSTNGASLFQGVWEDKNQFTSKQDAKNKMSVNFTHNYVAARMIYPFSDMTTSPANQSRKNMVMPSQYFSVGKTAKYIGKSSFVKVINGSRENLMTVKLASSKDHVVITNDGSTSGRVAWVTESTPALIIPWDGSNITY